MQAAERKMMAQAPLAPMCEQQRGEQPKQEKARGMTSDPSITTHLAPQVSDRIRFRD
jgi:hypothetical protein